MEEDAVIHLRVGGRPERVMFNRGSSAHDVKELFRAAAEAKPGDIVKLYNASGHLVNVSPALAANSSEQPYSLIVVASQCPKLIPSLGFDLLDLEKRVESLERTAVAGIGDRPPGLLDLQREVATFRKKLETVEHLSWLGLFKDLNQEAANLSPFYHRRLLRKTSAECSRVEERFLQVCDVELTEEVRRCLKTPTFDNWQWEDAEMLLLLLQMFLDLELVSAFGVERRVLRRLLLRIYARYNHIPFHNFQHCFCVSQMMYGLICITDLRSKMEHIDLLAMLTSSVCHDLDHPGYNNAYQINARTELALRYNDISPLENHHCAVAFELLEEHESNIFRNLTKEQYKRVREGMIKCILATDMGRHNDILASFNAILPTFDFRNREHTDVLMMIMIKVSDISNEARPMQVAEPWLDCLLQEFFSQSDVEKLEGLPVSPFMDRDKVSRSSSQVNFIRHVLLPLFVALATLFPALQEQLVEPVSKALEYYSTMEQALQQHGGTGRQSVAAGHQASAGEAPENRGGSEGESRGKRGGITGPPPPAALSDSVIDTPLI
ncbi:unnamed protein product [Lampetra planeri]